MGFKRPFDSEEFQELPLKQARPVDCWNKLTQFADNSPYHNVPKKLDISDGHENGFVNSQLNESAVNDCVIGGLNVPKDVETSTPLSLVTSSSSDEDVGSASAAYSTRFPANPEFEFPLRAFLPFEDFFSSYSDQSPRRQVPVGPNYQASIPSWVGPKENKLEQVDLCSSHGSSSSHGSNCNICEDEERLMGTCIIPMADGESSVVGIGREDCDCPDEGSIRCVQQHVFEAQEKLRKSLGHEKFVQLGFDDMGEEVSSKWTEEEEHFFRVVVYSNPASLGKNFWMHLSEVFPSRSTKEIISYYFNVFMLRRRAAQNRSISLGIDSDDDEFDRSNRESNDNHFSEDEDSGIESLPDQCVWADKRGNIYAEDDDDIDDENDDDSDGDVDTRDGSRDATGEDSGVDYVSEPHDIDSLDLSRFDSGNKHMDVKASGDITVQDDSCMSFELQADKTEYGGPVESEAAMQNTGAGNEHSKCSSGKGDGFGDVVGHVYLLDSCDAKVWDSRFTSPIKGVDLLPTCNIIEEIFGRGTCDDKTKK